MPVIDDFGKKGEILTADRVRFDATVDSIFDDASFIAVSKTVPSGFSTDSFTYSSDGLSLFIPFSFTNGIIKRSLTVPFDPTTAIESVEFAYPEKDLRYLSFNPDGTRFYVYDGSSGVDKFLQLDLSSPFELPVDSDDFDAKVSGELVPEIASGRNHRGGFSGDGRVFIDVSDSLSIVYYYQLSTPFDLNTAELIVNKSIIIEGIFRRYAHVYVNSDGSKFFLVSTASQFALIDTENFLSTTGNLSITKFGTLTTSLHKSIFYVEETSELQIYSRSGNLIETLPINRDLLEPKLQLNHEPEFLARFACIRLKFIDNGNKIFLGASSIGARIFATQEPFILPERLPIDEVLSELTTTLNERYAEISDDGLHVLIGDFSRYKYFQLSTPFDLSTASEIAELSASEIAGGSFRSATYADNGRYIFYRNGIALNRITLETPYDIRTTDIDSRIVGSTAILGDGSIEAGFSITADGLRGIIHDQRTQAFYTFELNTPFDITTALRTSNPFFAGRTNYHSISIHEEAKTVLFGSFSTLDSAQSFLSEDIPLGFGLTGFQAKDDFVLPDTTELFKKAGYYAATYEGGNSVFVGTLLGKDDLFIDRIINSQGNVINDTLGVECDVFSTATSETLNLPSVTTFNVSGNYIVPKGATFLKFKIWQAGGGGGAGGFNNENAKGGDGGSSGRFIELTASADDLPESLSITIGAGGGGAVHNSASSRQLAGLGGTTGFSPGFRILSNSFYPRASSGNTDGGYFFEQPNVFDVPTNQTFHFINYSGITRDAFSPASNVSSGGSSGGNIVTGAVQDGKSVGLPSHEFFAFESNTASARGGKADGDLNGRNGEDRRNGGFGGGGGASSTGKAGNGGNGAFGAGGGGGGATSSPNFEDAGIGGKGGNGKVVIYAW